MTDKELKDLVKSMETRELDDEARKSADGEFIRLSSGYTHYELKGEGEAMVLVHGYATPYFIYDKLFDALTNAGYKVLRYDLYGRGLSDRPDADYTPEFFATQLHELTSAVLGDARFSLVGTSMGGSICACFAAKYPEKVRKLMFLAPAGMDNFRPPFYMKLCRTKGLGEFVFYKVAGKFLLTGCAKELIYSPHEKDGYIRLFAHAAAYKGFLRSTLSSLRNTILKTQKCTVNYIKASESGVPILCIWGTNDRTMPYYQSARFKEVCPNAKLIAYEGSGHIFLYDEGERTANDVINFLRQSNE